ncbi:MAG: efflux transporter outer membrane subunit [Syntrophorhabdaceae bacterium]|nr:efflux transporter outer membrane subunit [Syntrophorhabdaceae bacterium]
MKRVNTVLCIAFAGLFFFGGCTLAPKYTRPDLPIPEEWPTGSSYNDALVSANAASVVDMPWKEVFPDARLQRVIDMALEGNRDLRIAVLNVERARALYGVQRAELLPTIEATGRGSVRQVPADLSGVNRIVRPEEYSVNLGLTSWEIDFFGRIRSLKDAALEQYLASEQARRSARILLVSGIANAYFSLAADQETLKLALSTIETQQAVYDLIKKRFDVGVSPELDLRQAQTRVDAARADAAFYTRKVAQDRNALDLLVGTRVPDDLFPEDLDSIVPPADIVAGLPSEVLLRRPDIMQAENLLRAANANIGAARAALFPRISLTASLGTASADLSRLFGSGQGVWEFTPKAVLPIFDARAWAALDVVKAEREILKAQYEKAVQTAFREVADALAIGGTIEEQFAAQKSFTEAVADTYRLSNLRYEKGIDSFLGVLDAQRSLYAAQQALISTRLACLSARITFYAILGGGDETPDTSR